MIAFRGELIFFDHFVKSDLSSSNTTSPFFKYTGPSCQLAPFVDMVCLFGNGSVNQSFKEWLPGELESHWVHPVKLAFFWEVGILL